MSTLKEHDYAAETSAHNLNMRPTGLDDDHHHHHHDDGNGQDTDGDSDMTGSDDEFDWDKDEEKKSNVANVRARRGRAVYLALMKLSRTVRTIIVGAIVAGILITPLLVVQFRFHDNSARTQVHVWSLWLTITWAAGCVTFIVVDLLPRLIIGVVLLVGGKVERLKIQVELAVAVSGWLKLALDISWCWIALGVIRGIYKPPQAYWTDVTRVVQAFFGAGLILLVEKLVLHLIAINFHQKAIADRLEENEMALRALDRLSNAQPTRVKAPGGKRGHKSPAASVDLKRAAPKAGKKKAVKRKPVTSVILAQVRQIAMKDSSFNKAGELGGLHNARRLARKLFGTLGHEREYLLVGDFYPYFPSTAEADEAFALFDKDGNGDITKKEMREAVQRIYKERKALVASLKDAGSAVSKLDAVMLSVALVCIIFVFLLIFSRENTLASLVPLGTLILGFSFIFGNAASTLFQSLIFIFATHVFDVGDLVMIDDQPLIVREFGLFATTFRRVDGQEIVAPNALLSGSKILHNIRRSRSMWETTTLMVSYSTPLSVLEELKLRIKAYVAENNRDWSGYDVNIDKMPFQNAIHIIVAMEHRPNWQDWGGRWGRRTAFMKNLKLVLEELDVRYTRPVQPVLMGSGGGPGLGMSGTGSMGGSLGMQAGRSVSSGLMPPR